MVTKMAEKGATRTAEGTTYQEEVVVKAPAMAVSAEIEEKVHLFIDNYVAYLKERTAAYKHRLLEAKPEAATPVLAGGYQYWNCLTVGPIQFYGDPPYRPSKIIAAGRDTLMLGVIWINPINGPGGSLPGTVVLAGRTCRVRFESINLSHVLNEPMWGDTRVFDNPAQTIYVFPWVRNWPDPGVTPNLYETTFTADVVETGQHMAAFSTWHLDLDTDRGFLGRPTVGPQGQYDIPARFLVYRE